jgi:hypothetical protein
VADGVAEDAPLAWPPPEARIDAEDVKREATAYVAAAAGSNAADMVANIQQVRCMSEEDQQMNTPQDIQQILASLEDQYPLPPPCCRQQC